MINAKSGTRLKFLSETRLASRLLVKSGYLSPLFCGEKVLFSSSLAEDELDRAFLCGNFNKTCAFAGKFSFS